MVKIVRRVELSHPSVTLWSMVEYLFGVDGRESARLPALHCIMRFTPSPPMDGDGEAAETLLVGYNS